MKKFDIDSKIQELRIPERDDAYWEAFPDRVLSELPAARVETPAQPSRSSILTWSLQFALPCLAAAFFLWQSHAPRALAYAVRHDEKTVEASVDRFRDNLGQFMQDEHGLGSLVEDQQ